jgi:hypothetical protein
MLAVINQLLLLERGGFGPAGARLLHHAYDAGQLLAAGLASLALVVLADRLAARFGVSSQRRWPRALALGLACFAVSLLIVGSDLANAARRHGFPLWLAVVTASTGFGLLFAATSIWAWGPRRLARGVLFVLGGGAGVANAFILLGDYPAAHLLLAWFSALLLANAVEGVLPRPRLAPWQQIATFGALSLLSFTTLLWPPPQTVLARLYSLPSAALAPFAARFYRARRGPALEHVRREFLGSPWFQPREGLAAVPATGALALAAPKLVVLLTIDALRADVVSQREFLQKLPGFTALHEGCAYFSQARTTTSATHSSLATVFTSRYFSQLRCRVSGLDYAGPRLPALVSAAGVRTVSLPRLNRIDVKSGVTLGFDTEIKGRFKAQVLAEKLIELMDAKRPLFLYAHFGEPHAPYQGRGSPFQRYLQEVARIDRALLRFFAFLQESGLAKHTLLLISSDHGEGFGEHGVNYHARIIYEEVARVPLFICGPGVAPRAVSEPVSLVDIAPTILDAFALPSPSVFMGQSLLPLAAGGNLPLARPLAIHAVHGLAGFYLRDGKKVIFNDPGKTVEVYDLAKDPAESANLSDSRDPAVVSAIESARLFFHQHQLALAREAPPERAASAAADEVSAEAEE